MIIHEYAIKNAVSRFDIHVKIYHPEYPSDWAAQTFIPEKTKLTVQVLEFRAPYHKELSVITHELVHIIARAYGGMSTNKSCPSDLEEDCADGIALFWDDLCRLRKLILAKNSEAEIG